MTDPTDNKAPGFAKRPDYPLTIEPAAKRVTVTMNGRSLADTRSALRLKESTYPDVYYIPRADVRMELLVRTDATTYCPFKGHASYWTIATEGAEVENAVWSYETPYDEMAPIREHVAFWLGKDDRLALKTDG